MLRLVAELDGALEPPRAAWLMVRREDLRLRQAPCASETVVDQVLLWKVSFRLPLEVFEYPQALFDISASGRAAIALPPPDRIADAAGLLAPVRRPRVRPLFRRSVVGLATGLALALAPDAFAAGPSAASAPTPTAQDGAAAGASPAATTAPAAASPPPASSAPTSIPTTSTPATTSAPAPPTLTPAPASNTTRTSAPGTATTVPRPSKGVPAQPSTGPEKPASSASTKTKPSTAASRGATSAPRQASAQGQRHQVTCAVLTFSAPQQRATDAGRHARQSRTPTACIALHQSKTRTSTHAPGKARKHRPGTSKTRPLPLTGAQLTFTRKPVTPRQRTPSTTTRRHAKAIVPPRTAPPSVPDTPWTSGFGIDPFTAAELARFSTVSASLDRPPAFLIPIYKAAGHRYDIPWQILAAINAIETNYGQNLAVSPNGAVGWMQFMRNTWLEYAARASGPGRPNPYDPRDAIFAAARLLAANGGAQDIRRALFAYNHALWYVDAVLWRASLISDRGLAAHLGRGGYALPLDAPYMAELGRTDDGVDIEDAPDGAAVYSLTPGVVTAVASDPGGFGPDYPVILVTAGALAGQYIYYGHVAASLVTVGQHVVAGQPIAVMGHTGDAASLGHGHIEIGFSDGSGAPLNQHGASAWTPSGAAMRTVLAALSHPFAMSGRPSGDRRRRLGTGRV